MGSDKKKALLVHWYYSVSEWEEFIKLEKKRTEVYLLVESFLLGLLGLLLLRFGRNASWLPALAISSGIAMLYGALRYYIRMRLLKWKGPGIPEVTISRDNVTINGKSFVFQGNGKSLVKVIILESNNRNVLEFTYEWNTRKGSMFDELTIPVPKGKLKEAMEILDCFNPPRKMEPVLR